MIKCEVCGQEFDESIAENICPFCGHIVEEGQPENNTFEDPRWLPIGTVLNGKYEIRKVIGAGGFGVTYKVWDQKHSVFKAVKEYFQQGVVNRIPGNTEVLISAPKRREEFEYGRERLLNEARIVAKFQSPSIVRVDDFFEENNTSYMVMEYLELDTLEDYITKRKRVLDVEQAVNFGVNLCSALDEIHKAGVIHRDIAPDNIFVADDGSVKIIDFGSARLSKEDIEDRMIVLKPGFAPPEQYEKIDPTNDKQQGWTDVYALGATLYLALTGKVPVESTNRKADADSNTDSLCAPKELNPNIPDYLNNVIMTAMAVDIHERLQSTADFQRILRMEKKILPLETVRKRKKARRTFGIGGGILLALVLAVVGYFWNQQRVHENILDAAEIAVWYSVSEDENLAEQKEDVMNVIKEEVEKSDEFSKISIELKAIPKSEYMEQLEIAQANGEMPSLYENVDDGFSEELGDVSLALNDVENGSCQFIDDYDSEISSSKMVPLAFSIPVVYVNTKLVVDYSNLDSISSMSEFMKLCDGEMEYKPLSLNEKDKLLFSTNLPDFTSYSDNFTGSAAEDFYEGESVAYFSDTSDYFLVRDALPGSYAMMSLGGTEILCDFKEYWSLSSCDAAERAAASRYLAYLLSNFVQDHYFLQNNLAGLPLEKQALAGYSDVRPAFEPLLEDVSIYYFAEK